MTPDEFAGFDLDDVVRKAEADKRRAEAEARKNAAGSAKNSDNKESAISPALEYFYFRMVSVNDRHWVIDWAVKNSATAIFARHNVDVKKDYLDNADRKTWHEWKTYSDRVTGTSPSDFYVPNALGLHRILSALYENRDNPGCKREVEKARSRLAQMFKSDYVPTLSGIVYDVSGSGEVIHSVPRAFGGTETEVNYRINVDPATSTREHYFNAILGDKDCKHAENVYKWLSGGNDVSIVTSGPRNITAPVLFTIDKTDKHFVIHAAYDVANTLKLPALGIR